MVRNEHGDGLVAELLDYALVFRQRLFELAGAQPVEADGLERALRHSAQDDTSLQEGVEALRRQLMNLLKAESVTPIEALGQPFDPELHEAIATVPADAEAGTIVDQIESGYKLKDKLLRPAKVVVAQ
jgi:molecular chaperone GrpE